MNIIKNRINCIFEKIGVEKIDALIIKNSSIPKIDPSFFYFTGLETGVFENSFLFLFPYGGILFAPKLEEESAKQSAKLFKKIIFENSVDLEKELRKEGKNFKKIGINSKEISYYDSLFLRKIFPSAILFDVSEFISEVRMIKDSDEILRLRDASRLTCEVWKDIVENLQEGVTEGEIKAKINCLFGLKSCTNAFDPIVAFSKKSAEPHYLGNKNRLKRGDLALFDFGARYRLYCADLTRTVIFGYASDNQRKMYNAVEEASKKGIESIKAGVNARDIHNIVSKVISSKGFGRFFTHSTGHSIGLSVHEDGKINSSSNFILKEGMAFTVEPGVYLPDIGGVRIEDDIVVCKDGCEILTPVSKEFTII